MKSDIEENKRRKDLKDFRNKANMLASMHSRLSDMYGICHAILSSFLLFISTILVGLTFISEQFVQNSLGISPNMLKWLMGAASILIFGGLLLLSQWNLGDKSANHREAVRFYFRIVNRARQWLDSNIEITEEMVEEIRTDYSRTQSLPKIPDFFFLRLKQWHMQKVAISRELDSHPFESLRSIRKRLSRPSSDTTDKAPDQQA